MQHCQAVVQTAPARRRTTRAPCSAGTALLRWQSIHAALTCWSGAADELELRTLQLQDLEAAEKRRRNELIDQRAVIAMNEQ